MERFLFQDQTTPTQYIPFPPPSYTDLEVQAILASASQHVACSHCSSNNDHVGKEPVVTTRRKLLLLLFVASLALTSMVLISEQLIRRHLERINVVEEVRNIDDDVPISERRSQELWLISTPAAGGTTAGEYVQLSVSDDGHGMDETTMNNVFEN